MRNDQYLTKRQEQIMELLVSGRTDREIGSLLFISRYTVRAHLRDIFGRLGVQSRVAAAAEYTRRVQGRQDLRAGQAGGDGRG